MEQPEKIKLYSSRDFSGNFDTTLAFIKQNYGIILKNLLVFIPVLLIAVFLMMSFLSVSANISKMAEYNEPLDMYSSMFSIQFILGAIIMTVTMFLIVLYPICYIAIYAESDNGVVDNSVVWSKVARSALPLIGYSIIYFILMFTGFIFCIIPGIIVAIYLIFYMYVYVIEDRGFIDTFQRSYELVKNNWWVTLGYSIVFSLLIGIVGYIFTLPIYLTMLGSFLKIDFLTSDVYIYITYSISYVARFMLNPIFYIALGIMYFSLRNKLEGIDMESEIDSIGENSSKKDTQY